MFIKVKFCCTKKLGHFFYNLKLYLQESPCTLKGTNKRGEYRMYFTQHKLDIKKKVVL